MPKSYSQGSQTREIICRCGFHISGSVREANMKLKLHEKKCEHCSKNTQTISEYNKSNALINGDLRLRNSNIGFTINSLKKLSNEKIALTV